MGSRYAFACPQREILLESVCDDEGIDLLGGKMAGTGAVLNPHRFQDQKDLLGLWHSPFHAHFRKKVDDLSDGGKFPGIRAFLPWHLVPWLTSYFKYAFSRKHHFLSHVAAGEQGVYPMGMADDRAIRFSIAGDWGTGTAEAHQVASQMSQSNPDYTIHLGDVYYVGDLAEIRENCLGQAADGYQGVTWPRGTQGSFAMIGNHEMYANGDGYFDYLIRTLGIPASRDRFQQASFFCIQNDVWRILAVDTGYNSVGWPIIGAIPFVNRLPVVGADCRLEEDLIRWLRKLFKTDNKPRATILLTHHQYFSAFAKGYETPARQLREFLSGHDVIWVWGHEHRFAVYGKASDPGFNFYGRCIGHGGMPIEIKKPKSQSSAPLQFYDERIYKEKDKLGLNGYLNFELKGDKAVFDYRDLNGKSVLREQFMANGTRLTQSFIYVDPQLSRGSSTPANATYSATGGDTG